MIVTDELFDAGLQPERTALAWRRTALALVVASCTAARILPEVLGGWAVIPAGAGVAWTVVLMVLIHRRHRTVHRNLVDGRGGAVTLPSGLLPFATAAVVSCGGTAALVAVCLAH